MKLGELSDWSIWCWLEISGFVRIRIPPAAIPLLLRGNAIADAPRPPKESKKIPNISVGFAYGNPRWELVYSVPECVCKPAIVINNDLWQELQRFRRFAQQRCGCDSDVRVARLDVPQWWDAFAHLESFVAGELFRHNTDKAYVYMRLTDEQADHLSRKRGPAMAPKPTGPIPAIRLSNDAQLNCAQIICRFRPEELVTSVEEIPPNMDDNYRDIMELLYSAGWSCEFSRDPVKLPEVREAVPATVEGLLTSSDQRMMNDRLVAAKTIRSASELIVEKAQELNTLGWDDEQASVLFNRLLKPLEKAAGRLPAVDKPKEEEKVSF